MPSFVTGIYNFLEEVASWFLYLTPVAIGLVLIQMGWKLKQADDGMDTKEIKKKAERLIVGIALIGGGIPLGIYIWGFFQ